MADGHDVNRAMNLLREAASLLSGNAPSLPTTSTTESSSTPVTSRTPASRSISSTNSEASVGCSPDVFIAGSDVATTSQRNTPNFSQSAASASHLCIPNSEASNTSASHCLADGNNRRENVLKNFSTLFAPYSVIASTAREYGQPPRKQRKRGRGQSGSNFQARETWTHEVFCVADCGQQATPSRALKAQLQRAGLGRMKIRFDANANPTEFKEALENTFPKLMWGGGFELLRRGPSGNELVVIPPPPRGYSVPFLRSSSGIGQAILYVRPMQCKLDVSEEKSETVNYSQVKILFSYLSVLKVMLSVTVLMPIQQPSRTQSPPPPPGLGR